MLAEKNELLRFTFYVLHLVLPNYFLADALHGFTNSLNSRAIGHDGPG